MIDSRGTHCIFIKISETQRLHVHNYGQYCKVELKTPDSSVCFDLTNETAKEFAEAMQLLYLQEASKP